MTVRFEHSEGQQSVQAKRGNDDGDDCDRLDSGPSVPAWLKSVWAPRGRSWLGPELQSSGNLQSCSCREPERQNPR